MQLSDIMGHAGLAGYAVIALIIFFVVFLVVVARLLWPSNRKKFERDKMIPLDDDEQPHSPSSGEGE